MGCWGEGQLKDGSVLICEESAVICDHCSREERDDRLSSDLYSLSKGSNYFMIISFLDILSCNFIQILT